MEASPGLAPATPASALSPFLTAQIDAAFPSLGPPSLASYGDCRAGVFKSQADLDFSALPLTSSEILLPLTRSTTY